MSFRYEVLLSRKIMRSITISAQWVKSKNLYSCQWFLTYWTNSKGPRPLQSWTLTVSIISLRYNKKDRCLFLTNKLRYRQQYGEYQRGKCLGQVEEGTGINSDRKRLDFGWWASSTIYRWCIIELYTWNLNNFTNQCHPNKFNFKKMLI